MGLQMKMTKKTITLLSLGVLLLFVILGVVLLVSKAGRKSRGNATTRALESAITAYYNEYKRWPTELAVANGLEVSNDAPGGAVFVIPGPQNWMVFDMLRSITNPSPITPIPCNQKNIRFLDDNKYLVLSEDKCVPRSQVPADLETEGLIEAGHPLVYLGADGVIHYFTVVFEVDANKVNVEL